MGVAAFCLTIKEDRKQMHVWNLQPFQPLILSVASFQLLSNASFDSKTISRAPLLSPRNFPLIAACAPSPGRFACSGTGGTCCQRVWN